MRDELIEFMDSLRDYVAESGTNIAHDERDSREFVDIFLNQWQELPIDSVSVSLPDTDELFKLAHDYAYKRCSLQNFDSEADIELVKIRYVHGYEQALKDFVNGDYDPDQL